MAATAQQAIQARIDAQQILDTIEYGLRSIRACGGAMYCTGVHAGQLERARQEAAGIGYTVRYLNGAADAGMIAVELREAKAAARELLAECKADVKAIGTVRQLRLALAATTADTHEYALGA